MRSVRFAVWCAALVTGLQLASAGTPYNFNPGWKLAVGDAKGAEAAQFDDGSWKVVTLPHAYNEDDAFRKDIAELTVGISWYRKSFVLPAGVSAANNKVIIEFQGARHAAEVWVNGKRAGLSENGVMAFGFDITDALLPAPTQNVVAVRVDNTWTYKEVATGSSFQWNDRNFYANYGGINKNVILHVLPKLYQTLPLYSNLKTSGVYIYAKDINVSQKSATIVAEGEVRNETGSAQSAEYSVTIEDMDGKAIATFSAPAVNVPAGETVKLTASAPVSNLNFWSWGYGYLYNVKTAVKVGGSTIDEVTTRTGFRKTEFANGALKLNDRTLHLKGHAQRTTNEWPALGINLPPWVSDFSNGLMVAENANLVRWMHVTPSKQDVESCDRVGLIQAMPAGDSERDVTDRRWDMRKEVMRDAIIYNRNNPSIIFYESGNKGISDKHMEEMVALKKQWDPNGGRAIGSREMLGSSVAEWGGEMLYINKSSTKVMWATEYSRDENLRTYADELTPPYHKNGDGPGYKTEPSLAYNRNQDSFAIEGVTRWYDYFEARPGTGARVNGGGVNIIFSDSNTHHRGTENYRRSGEVDAMRIPKEAYFAHQVMWNGWVNPEKQAAHIIGHWNYPQGTTKNVYVVSTADRVELTLNNQPLGSGEKSVGFLYTFKNVKWQAGALKAVGYDAAGKQVCETVLETAGEPVAVKLTPHTGPGGFRADGSDLALVDVEVVDAQGRRCPTAFNPISFNLAGPAEWRGGIAKVEGNGILAKTLPVELGVNRVTVRSIPEAGKITLQATTPGLKSAEITLETKPVEVVGGLAPLAVPIPSSLSRGPTPAGDSVVITRKPITVASVTAGSKPDDAKLSCDDNEETSWANDGKLESAWITYTFGKPTTVSEVVLKLSAWRTTSYPIRITVDDKEVFAGGTARSLGYCTIPVTPTKGTKLKIQLIGESKDRDDFDLTEITGMKQTAGTKGNAGDAKGTLRIVEAELYAPVTE